MIYLDVPLLSFLWYIWNTKYVLCVGRSWALQPSHIQAHSAHTSWWFFHWELSSRRGALVVYGLFKTTRRQSREFYLLSIYLCVVFFRIFFFLLEKSCYINVDFLRFFQNMLNIVRLCATWWQILSFHITFFFLICSRLRVTNPTQDIRHRWVQ